MPNQSPNLSAIETLYHAFLTAWNNRDAAAYAALVALDGNLIGFDGSSMNGRAEVQSAIQKIFADHPTSRYVSKIREVRSLGANVMLLRAVVGMVPPGENDIKPDVNALQSLVATKQNGQWLITLFQNTPAAFHGRPDETAKLTAELRELL